MHAPGFNAVGLMLPGLPFVAVGRNQHIAWGGTNLHAASSDLVDVSGLPSSAFTEREEIVSVRGRPPVTLRLRETEYGPVVTDGMIVRSDRPASLRWVGHQPSDEMTAMLGVNRATGWEEFRTALTGFAVPGQTMVYADAAGSVGQVIAAHLPPRHATPPSMLTPPEPWGPIVSTALDRFRHDPAEGFIASANDSPGGLPVGYFFAPSHRVDRLRQLLGGGPPIDAAAMRAVQTDVQVSVMPRLHAILLPKLRSRTPKQAETVDILRGWTGRYDADSRGALAWELLLGHLVAALRHNAEFAHYSAIWTARLMLTEDIARVPPGVLAPALALALRHTTAGVRRYGNWGAVHHIRLAHPLARLPLGERFAVQFPAPRQQRHAEQERARARDQPACLHLRRLRPPRLGSGGPGFQRFRAARRPGWLARQQHLCRPGGSLAPGPVHDPAAAAGDRPRALPPRHDAAAGLMLDATPLLRLRAALRTTALARQDPAAAQRHVLSTLLHRARTTQFGRAYGFDTLRSVSAYQTRVPLRRYEAFWQEWWQPCFPRLRGSTWPGRIPYFALSSGTSGGPTKYIPVSLATIRANQAAALDTLVFHATARPGTRVLAGRKPAAGRQHEAGTAGRRRAGRRPQRHRRHHHAALGAAAQLPAARHRPARRLGAQDRRHRPALPGPDHHQHLRHAELDAAVLRNASPRCARRPAAASPRCFPIWR